MPIDVAKLLITVGSDITGAEKGLKSASDKLDSFASQAAKVGGALTLGVTTPLVALGTQAVFAASDLEESMNKVRVVFGDTSDDIISFSRTASQNLGMSQQAALEATGTFGNLFTTMGLGIEDASEMSQSIVTLASDLASFNNIDPTVALEKLRAGLVGEVEPLRTLGVNIQESTVQLEAMEMGLADTADELTNQDKVMARYALIMEQTGNAQGDFARTSDGLANQMRTLRGSFTDAAAALGQVLLPYATTAVTKAVELVQKFQGLDEGTQKVIVTFGALAAAAGPLAIAISAVTKAVAALQTVLALANGPITLIIAAAAALTGAVILLEDHIKDLGYEVEHSAIVDPLTGALINETKVSLDKTAVAADDTTLSVMNLSSAAIQAAQFIQKEMVPVTEVATADLEELAQAAEDAAMALVQTGISGELAGGIENYTETITRLREEYASLQEQTVGWSPASTHVKDLTEAMNQNAQAQEDALAAMREATTQMIFQQAAAGLDAVSTLELARAMGVLSEQDYAVATKVQDLKTQFEGLDGVMSTAEAAGYADTIANLNTAVANLVEAGLPVTIENINQEMANLQGLDFPEFETDVWDNLHTDAETAIDKMTSTVDTGFGGMVTIASESVTDIQNAFTGENWSAVGTSITGGMAQGISQGAAQVEAAARLAAQRALAAAMAELGIKSPSKEFAWIGEQTMAGLAAGIRDNAMLPVREAALASGATTVGATYYSTYSPNVNVQATVASEIDMYRLSQEIADEIRRGRL